MSYLGIDLGTSGLRALLVDDDGVPVGATERSYDVANPHPGWSEQDPAEWWSGTGGCSTPRGTVWRTLAIAGHVSPFKLATGGRC